MSVPDHVKCDEVKRAPINSHFILGWMLILGPTTVVVDAFWTGLAPELKPAVMDLAARVRSFFFSAPSPPDMEKPPIPAFANSAGPSSAAESSRSERSQVTLEMALNAIDRLSEQDAQSLLK